MTTNSEPRHRLEPADTPAALTAYALEDLDEAQALRFRLIVAASLALGGNDSVTGEDAISVAEYVLGPQESKPSTWGA